MTAGRELDAIVAEKVMGIAVVGWGEVSEGVVFFDGGHSDPLYLLQCECEGAKRIRVLPEEWKYGHWFACLSGVPAYSTEIAAAWEVVEKMRGDTYTLELYSPDALVNDERGVYARNGWRADFMSWDLINQLPEGEADGCDTAPLAICLAALAAVGAKVPA